MPGRRRDGRVYLVGAGPGDPDLITVRGLRALQRADLVIADVLAPSELLRLARPGARLIRTRARYRGGRMDQGAVNRLMIARARRGMTVVRLKGGDPLVFGRGGEEAEALARAGVPFEIVPGVTAALGAAACAGVPLTDRRHASTLVLATAHVGDGKDAGAIDWRLLAGAGTAVIYMGVRRLAGVVRGLIKAGRDPETPAALVRWATRPEQTVVAAPLRTLVRRAREASVRPPALLIVGSVVRLRGRLDWFSRRPLAGRTIVVTRARGQAAAFTATLRDHGARVLETPAIAIAPPLSWAPLRRALGRLGEYRFLVFTSVNGVERFFERLRHRRIDLRALHGAKVVAIGPATAAALEARGLRVAAVPEEYRAEGVVEVMGRLRLRGARVLIPRAAVARDLLVRALRRRGARVDVVPVYRAVASRDGISAVTAALRAGEIDLLTFASSSTVIHFLRRFPSRADRRRLRAVPAAVIGPITAATARRLGLRVTVMPADYTIPALAEAIVRRFRRARRSVVN